MLRPLGPYLTTVDSRSLEGVGWSVEKRERLASWILGDSMTSSFAAGITGVGGAVPQRSGHPDRA